MTNEDRVTIDSAELTFRPVRLRVDREELRVLRVRTRVRSGEASGGCTTSGGGLTTA